MSRGVDGDPNIWFLVDDLLEEIVFTERNMRDDLLQFAVQEFASTLCSLVSRLPESENGMRTDERQFDENKIRSSLSLDELDQEQLSRFRCLSRYASAVAVVLQLHLKIRSCNGYLADYSFRDPTLPIAQEALTSIRRFLQVFELHSTKTRSVDV